MGKRAVRHVAKLREVTTNWAQLSPIPSRKRQPP